MAIRRIALVLLGLSLSVAGRADIYAANPAAGFTCGFQTSWVDCGFAEQAKAPGRITLAVAEGLRGVRLRTQVGDDNVAGSGAAERADLSLSQEATACYEGQEQWWAHSILFPDDYVAPAATPADRWPWGVVFDFHQTGGEGQANFQIEVAGNPARLRFSISAGPIPSSGAPGSPTRRWPIGPVKRNVWYHFVYHMKWSSGNDGFFQAWVNGEKMLDHHGPTLYAGQGCYLKLANYHTPVGKPVSVIHARVIRGTTASAVVPGPPDTVYPR